MNPFAVEVEDRSGSSSAKVTLAHARDLTSAVRLLANLPSGAYVVYLPSDLQRRVFNGRIVWLDGHGQEAEPPPRREV